MIAAAMNSRLRQIAILVASVDSEAARQLLLSLPSEIARNVRQMAAEMGPIPPEERRALMEELKRSRSAMRAAHEGWSAADGASPIQSNEHPSSKAPLYPVYPSSSNLFCSDEIGLPQGTNDSLANADGASPAWTKLSVEALVRFVRHERPTVIAVIIHQLPPQRAASVLQKLPASLSRQVLNGLRNLQEIDPEAMTAIDEHLSQRLSEYHHRIESDLENAKKINLLLAAAPPELKQQWSQWLKMDVNGNDEFSEESVALRSDSSLQADAQSYRRHIDPSSESRNVGPLQSRSEIESSGELESDHILPFRPIALAKQAESNLTADLAKNADRERRNLQQEFDKILTLNPEQLARMLGLLDSHSILLSLAGAHPRFIKQFNALLEPRDARLLEDRLKRIGPVHLKEIDEAQKKVVQTFRAFCEVEVGSRAA